MLGSLILFLLSTTHSSLLGWVWNLGEWGGGDGLTHCWALRNQAQAMDGLRPGLMLFLCASFAAGARVGVGGVGGRAFCHLNSGREHLAMRRWRACPCNVGVGVVGVSCRSN